jgi:hypothetical protein
VRAAWWHEQQDEVVDGFLVEPQNQCRVGTTWEPSHEWRLAEATPSLRGLQWFTRKQLGYSAEPQNRGRRLDEEMRPPRPVQPPGRGGQTAWGRSDLPGRSNRPRGRSESFEAEDTRRDHKACIEANQAAVAEHPSDEEIPKTSKSAPEGLVSLVIR